MDPSLSHPEVTQPQKLQVSEAKERLLAWALAGDAHVKPGRSTVMTTATLGVGALVAGLVLRGGMRRLGKVASFAFIVRSLPWIIPIIKKALANRTNAGRGRR